MADQNAPQAPPAAQQPVPAATPDPAPITVSGVIAPPVQLPLVSAPVLSLKERFLSAVKDLWAKYNVLFIVVGALILVAKFGDLAISFYSWLSKREVTNTQKEDVKLKAKEDAANQQADALVQDAQTLPSKETPVDENWNKKK